MMTKDRRNHPWNSGHSAKPVKTQAQNLIPHRRLPPPRMIPPKTRPESRKRMKRTIPLRRRNTQGGTRPEWKNTCASWESLQGERSPSTDTVIHARQKPLGNPVRWGWDTQPHVAWCSPWAASRAPPSRRAHPLLRTTTANTAVDRRAHDVGNAHRQYARHYCRKRPWLTLGSSPHPLGFLATKRVKNYAPSWRCTWPRSPARLQLRPPAAPLSFETFSRTPFATGSASACSTTACCWPWS